jgi:hypothetical protein
MNLQTEPKLFTPALLTAKDWTGKKKTASGQDAAAEVLLSLLLAM